MMGLGWQELTIVLVIVIIIFGAGKLPELGSGLGRGIRDFKLHAVEDDGAAPVTATGTRHGEDAARGQATRHPRAAGRPDLAPRSQDCAGVHNDARTGMAGSRGLAVSALSALRPAKDGRRGRPSASVRRQALSGYGVHLER